MTLRLQTLSMPSPRVLVYLLLIALSLPATQGFSQQNWPRFRGENGTGVSDQKGIPTTFSPGDFAWNISLPGKGHGSPIVWGDQLFVTSASETGDQDGGEKRELYCINVKNGEIVWKKDMGFNTSHKHAKNSFASSTPARTGNRSMWPLPTNRN